MSSKVDRYLSLTRQRVSKRRSTIQVKMNNDKQSAADSESGYANDSSKCENNASVQDFFSTFGIPEEPQNNKGAYIIIEPDHNVDTSNIHQGDSEGKYIISGDVSEEQGHCAATGSKDQQSKVDFLLNRLKTLHDNYEQSLREMQAAKGSKSQNKRKIKKRKVSSLAAFDSSSGDSSVEEEDVKPRKVKRTVSTQTSSIVPITRQDLDDILKKHLDVLQNSIVKYVNKKVSNSIQKYGIEDGFHEPPTFQKRPVVLENIFTFNDFTDTYKQYTFPIKTTDEFTIFLTDLENNVEDVKTNFKQYLVTSINFQNDLLDSIKNVIKKMMSKNVIQDYTPQRSKPGKLLFKDTEFYKILQSALFQVYNTYLPNEKKISEKHVLTAIGMIFSNAKDWEGGRLARLKRDNKLNIIAQ